MQTPSPEYAGRTPTGAAHPKRANLIAGFDELPDSALVSVPVAAAVIGRCETTFRENARSQPEHPKVIRLSYRCTRVRVGELRGYLAQLGRGAMQAAGVQA